MSLSMDGQAPAGTQRRADLQLAFLDERREAMQALGAHIGEVVGA
ncbi:MAG TPA: hypothetical protein VNV38_21250 [Stellaceae bacterium]|jgi:hypothetical protein|nr:hypothetical protein [Stellaceae bacterium]